MPKVEIRVPQMGEGLTEVRILEFQKKPGDLIKRDDLIYSMETDKANLEVESPEEGMLVEWLAKEGDILPIGAPIACIETSSPVQSTIRPAAMTQVPFASPVASELPPSPLVIPPRTRAHAREQGISAEELRAISAASGKLMPSDVDAYLAQRVLKAPTQPGAAVPGAAGFVARQLSDKQRTFLYRIKRSSQLVVPGTIMRPIEWHPVKQYVEMSREREPIFRPTEFQTFAYCTARAITTFPKFRSTLPNDETVHEYLHVNLGIAVARPDGDLVTAVVTNADSLDFETFVRTAQEQIRSAREGQDQANASLQFLLTYLGGNEVRDAIPVLVAPAIAILFIGAAYEQNTKLLANLSLTFDHRLINGLEAAEFLQAVNKSVHQLEE